MDDSEQARDHAVERASELWIGPAGKQASIQSCKLVGFRDPIRSLLKLLFLFGESGHCRGARRMMMERGARKRTGEGRSNEEDAAAAAAAAAFVY